MPEIGLWTDQLLCHPPNHGSCKTSRYTTILFTFFYFQNLTFNSGSDYSHFFMRSLVVSREEFTSYGPSMHFLTKFPFFYSNRGLKRYFFTFFVLQRVFLIQTLAKINNSPIRIARLFVRCWH